MEGRVLVSAKSMLFCLHIVTEASIEQSHSSISYELCEQSRFAGGAGHLQPEFPSFAA